MKEHPKINVWFPEKNWGFAYWMDKNKKMISHFVHIANVISGREHVKVGAEITFYRAESKKGWLAVEVEVAA
jgi:hypothetical protein